mmetsp:Transcript_27581/g.40554  ORF Transcript_27581/g.40554 Transcript_27581/m.40554 type:complete len:166 (+) Transcript_27581:3903-4400(+)
MDVAQDLLLDIAVKTFTLTLTTAEADLMEVAATVADHSMDAMLDAQILEDMAAEDEVLLIFVVRVTKIRDECPIRAEKLIITKAESQIWDESPTITEAESLIRDECPMRAELLNTMKAESLITTRVVHTPVANIMVMPVANIIMTRQNIIIRNLRWNFIIWMWVQ